MRHIVLDTSALLSQPSTVSFTAPDTRLVVPASVATEFVNLTPSSGGATPYIPLLDQIVDSGTAQIVTVPPFPEVHGSLPIMLRLGPVEQDVLAVATSLKEAHPQDEVVIATDDRDLQAGGKAVNVRTLTPRQLTELLRPSATQDDRVRERAADLTRYQRKHLIGSALAGALATAAGTILIQNIDRVASTMNVWGALIAVPALSLGLFWWRSRFRLAYGVAEVGVGLVAALNVVLPGFDVSQIGITAILQLLGGLYITVRGLDNVGRGLERTRFSVKWKEWFPS